MSASERWECDRCGAVAEVRPEADEFERANSRKRWLEVLAVYQSPRPREEPDATGIMHYCPECAAAFRAHVQDFTAR